MKLAQYLRRLWPILFITLLWLGLVIINVTPGTWLTGWDNLHPEFDIPLHIFRSIHAVWQEYQGPGLLGGMGHAADLPRILLLGLLQLIIPTMYLRYVWTLGMLLVGSLGMYTLLHRIVLPPVTSVHIRTISLIGALFYMLNLATVQMFYVPFEPFVTHFGFLPWLAFGLLHFLAVQSRRSLIIFILLNILASTQAYVPTIFLVYLLLVTCLSISHLAKHRFHSSIKPLLTIWITILFINVYWLLPFGYFTLTNSSVTVESKINQIATDEVYLRNKAYGNLWDSLTLKGFWLDTFDFDPTASDVVPILNSWQDHLNTPVVQIVLVFLVLPILTGGLFALRNKHISKWPVLVFVLSVAMLTTVTPPFSWLQDALRRYLPFFHQIFRFPFTKFSILAGFSYSLLLAIGLVGIQQWFQQHNRKGYISILGGILICLVLLSSPLFTGNMFYHLMKRTIPSEYFQLFTYFKLQPQQSRIANLPQPTYWGWSHYAWGYTGSGFLWHGISQSIMDRAFDVWSRENENYYWELSRAIYKKDSQALDLVLQKYGITHVILDTSIRSTGQFRALYLDEIQTLLKDIPDIPLDAQVGGILVYKRLGQQSSTGTGHFPTVYPAYRFSDIDPAYQGTPYISSQLVDDADEVYPFRSLFTKRSVSDQAFHIREDDQTLTVESQPFPVEYLSALQPTSESTDSGVTRTATTITYTLDKPSTISYDSTSSGALTAAAVSACDVSRDGEPLAEEKFDGKESYLRVRVKNQRQCLGIYLPTLFHELGYILAVRSRHEEGRGLLMSVINETARHVEMESYLPTATDWQTTYFILPPLAVDGRAYTILFTNDAIGLDPTTNDIASVKVYSLPVSLLTSYKMLPATSSLKEAPTPLLPITNTHPNPESYEVQFTPTEQSSTLVLSQAFHPGWVAYEITGKNSLAPTLPFLFGTKIVDHVLVNNWANGWNITKVPGSADPERTIVIYFLPQLLEYLGFFLLPLPFLWAFWPKRGRSAR